ncbi:MAG: uncharacterized protein KVP18_002114 [Porospora cf. gigantea A]|uniref:uncharacterized protein n=1 Tax=Porospora cf. gigantea A TaxID=2853593 RepID=UPI00355A126A|nr:MAG: hypothetical protein KVP18_002114 [Porospora cf. gigantea A]
MDLLKQLGHGKRAPETPLQSQAKRFRKSNLPEADPEYYVLSGDRTEGMPSSIGELTGMNNDRLMAKIGDRALAVTGSASTTLRASKKLSREPQFVETLTTARLSRRKLKSLGLLQVETDKMTWNEMQFLHQLWSEYAGPILSFDLPPRSRAERLIQMDLHGARLAVEKTTVPSLAGVEGIVVQDCKNAFKLLRRDDRVVNVPKKHCTFRLSFQGASYLLFGPNFTHTGPSRSKLKLKQRDSICL